MKAKRWLTGCAAVVMAAMMAAGCGNSMETEEEIITFKEENADSVEGGASAEAVKGQEQVSGNGELGGIAEQVQAPEHYTADLEAGNVHVKVDAPVVIPEGEGFKTYLVKSRPFKQADYDAVSHVLLADAGLWERDQDAMAASRGLTREEIEKRIVRIGSEIAEAEAAGPEAVKLYEAKKGKGIEEYEKELKQLETILENAPTEPVLVEVPAVVTVNAGDQRQDNKEGGWLYGYATVDGKDYAVSLDNMLREDWKWNTFQILKEVEETGSFQEYYSFAGLSDGQKENAPFSIEEIKGMAQEAVTAMGLTDFFLSGEEYYAIYGNEEEYDSIQDAVQKIGYGIHFTRSFDGVPVTYTSETGTSLEDGESVVWPYENLTLVYNEEGLVNFVWGNPYEVEKVSDEYLFLLPFSEIQNIFEEMIIKKYQDWIDGSEDIRLDFRIEEVRLGYMRVREKGNAEEATMVPVWDFLGEQSITYSSGDTTYDEGSVFNSRITVNALDGTIIDRGFGY